MGSTRGTSSTWPTTGPRPSEVRRATRSRMAVIPGCSKSTPARAPAKTTALASSPASCRRLTTPTFLTTRISETPCTRTWSGRRAKSLRTRRRSQRCRPICRFPAGAGTARSSRTAPGAQPRPFASLSGLAASAAVWLACGHARNRDSIDVGGPDDVDQDGQRRHGGRRADRAYGGVVEVVARASDATRNYECIGEGGGLPSGSSGRCQGHVVAPQEHDPVRDAVAVGVKKQIEARRPAVARAGERERQGAKRPDRLPVHAVEDRRCEGELIVGGFLQEHRELAVQGDFVRPRCLRVHRVPKRLERRGVEATRLTLQADPTAAGAHGRCKHCYENYQEAYDWNFPEQGLRHGHPFLVSRTRSSSPTFVQGGGRRTRAPGLGLVRPDYVTSRVDF